MNWLALWSLQPADRRLIETAVAQLRARGLPYDLARDAEHARAANIVVLSADDAALYMRWRAHSARHADHDAILLCDKRLNALRPCEHEMRRGADLSDALQVFGRIDLRRRPKAPLAADTARTAVPGVARGRSNPARPTWARVLVVDDSETIRRQMKLLLGLLAVHVDCADSGELAVHLLTTVPIDLVFLDVQLPGADGYQICKTIKRNRARTSPPVVMLTSQASPFDRVRGALAGCDGYLAKPPNPARIEERLRALLPAAAKGLADSMPAVARGAR